MPDADPEAAMVELDERIAHIEALLTGDEWAGRVIWRGGYPRLPVVDTLPVAAEQYAYAMLCVRATPDVHYTCLRDAGGTWGWKIASTG